jgi:tRNA G18 (ribose-2'-O)-methylase SpoU
LPRGVLAQFNPPDWPRSKAGHFRGHLHPAGRLPTIRLMREFVHERHKPLAALERPRELIVACAPLRSNVNLSRIVRVASCSGVSRAIACGTAKLIDKIARDGADAIRLEVHRTLPPVLKELKQQGYQLVGLEQTTNSQNLHTFAFARKTVLVVGNERAGLTDDVLAVLDHVVEIPVYGLPYSYNVATAADMALYEYCRQYPRG